jgi:hypothetical protein
MALMIMPIRPLLTNLANWFPMVQIHNVQRFAPGRGDPRAGFFVWAVQCTSI